MVRQWAVIAIALLAVSATGAYVYATSSNPTPEEQETMTDEQLRQIEPAYSGGGVTQTETVSEQERKDGTAGLFLEDVAPEAQKEVREVIARGEEPRLRLRSDGLLELDKQ